MVDLSKRMRKGLILCGSSSGKEHMFVFGILGFIADKNKFKMLRCAQNVVT